MCYEQYIHDEKTYRNIVRRVWTEILEWGRKNMRIYPWRSTQDAYKLIIAEIMLHRTKADQVKDLYELFIKKYPDFKSIVKAGPENIKSELHSLGLPWRSDLLYRMAEEVVKKYDGTLPLNRMKLMELPGVGHYIASAVLCFGYNLPEPVLDTNTVRVIGRVFGIKITDSSRRSKKFEKIVSDLVTCGEPRSFSLSLIDFAAMICIPGNNPECEICPLRGICCFYGKRGDMNEG
ncbi:DNA glycosylase [Candidatus Bathyarchaeota archaeon]|uniref:DNA glycosylase n=1 Tax=Candidatus Aciduliprofundum boonei TaxID=379547 RepID=A0A7J3TA77_9ARCH|nr:MAG: DNA glycosylase [Candidatus Bathyarchaeota archaeon]RLI54247.1 MAG: DNA glycosylase [Candidatus Thorarchaeota archaeon]HHE75841.1 DNA glycosylase [Candidatus Aciduliprofundum boonei]